MHDWRQTIRERIESHRLPQAHREEVTSQLAADLEEDYYDARSRSLTDTEAFAIALREVEDWRVLAADIRRTKSEEDEMNARTESLRLPGMLGLAGASILIDDASALRLATSSGLVRAGGDVVLLAMAGRSANFLEL
jgi:hypothetical protein